MPRITKKMKLEELRAKEERINVLVLQCMGFSVDMNTKNVTDQTGKRLIYNGKTDMGKFVKWGEGPFNRREIKFDPVNDYQLSTNLFNAFIEKEIRENKEEGIEDGITYVRTICLKDGDPINNMPTKYVELDVTVGKIISESYVHPTLAYIEIILGQSSLLSFNEDLLRRVDDLKNEME